MRARFGRLGIAGILLLVIYLALGWLAPQSALRTPVFLALAIVIGWMSVRLLRLGFRYATWRLRYRLLVTYLFIAVVPILLLGAFAWFGGRMLVNQIAVYLVTSQIDHRIDALAQAGESLLQSPPSLWPEEAPRVEQLLGRVADAGIEILLRHPANEFRYPPRNTLPTAGAGRPSARGIVLLDGRPYLWSHRRSESGTVTISQPLTRELLAGLAQGLGVIDFAEPPPSVTLRSVRVARTGRVPSRVLPPAYNRFDSEVNWFATIPTAEWKNASETSEDAASLYIVFRTRVSAILAAVFNRSADVAQETIQFLLAGIGIVFLVVELASLVIGVGITRTITGAVHRLYEGTQKVTEGDFAHRIEVKGNDQLAELSHSFNRMTENVERLLTVAKEKERLQSELEIAREVQSRLFPREAPRSNTLQVTAVCKPARMVSGDYYDYMNLGESQIALTIADVAGKGISAALLMAAIQSSLHTDLHAYSGGSVSPAQVVEKLNRQIHATTSPEKYATLCLGIYDDTSGELTYTNAGHLPPILIRNGEAQRLDVTGTVVGAFPKVKYQESRVTMEPGDLLVFYTDGATEPENHFEEMFGEERFTGVVMRNAHRSGEEVLEAVSAAIREWTGSDELQDDLTLLLARRA